jgi:hypothetical protein
MKLIAYGDLYTNYYFKNNLLEYISGGKSNSNILYNVADTFKTKFIGVVGNDKQGEIALLSLNNKNVDIGDIKRINESTQTIFYLDKRSTRVCPYCDRMRGYSDAYVSYKDVISKTSDDDIFVIDSLEELDLDIINNTNNKIVLYLNDINYIKRFSLNELIELLKDRCLLLCLGNKVNAFIKDKYKIDLFDFKTSINASVLISFKTVKDFDIIYLDTIEEKEIEGRIYKENMRGSLDLYIAEFLKVIIGKDIDDKVISLAHLKAAAMYIYSTTIIGERIDSLYKIRDYKECICKDISID